MDENRAPGEIKTSEEIKENELNYGLNPVTMSDVFSKSKRSEVMAAIRSAGNKATELRLARIFRRLGITGWRRKQKVFGNPDFVFKGKKLAVFVDGCFWHGCPRHLRIPRTNRQYWSMKIQSNRKRDAIVSRRLRASGWKVLRVWEHEMKNPQRLIFCLCHLLK